jgi:hypothetical protein
VLQYGKVTFTLDEDTLDLLGRAAARLRKPKSYVGQAQDVASRIAYGFIPFPFSHRANHSIISRRISGV